ncbi:hypothetical protein [Natranaerobius trueperi]|uniref:hypothetical protein n=1 Tax=Natranaerobius trueperi TaxID=759412 RepID=UPI00130324D8|nr:hypothetical protein [Natranaerobius trueperi]
MSKKNQLDKLPLAELESTDLNRLKKLEHEMNNKYNTDIYLMALSDEDKRD